MSEKQQATLIKRVTNAELWSDGTILLQNVRFSYPHVFKKYAGDDGGDPKYGIVALLSKKTHVAAKDLCVEEINKILAKNRVQRLGADKKFIRNGDDHSNPAYMGYWTVSCRETRRPIVLDRDGRTELDPDQHEDLIYGGGWGSVMIRPWWQANKFGQRVNAGFLVVQRGKDDERFGEGAVDKDSVVGRFSAQEGSGYADNLDDPDEGL